MPVSLSSNPLQQLFLQQQELQQLSQPHEGSQQQLDSQQQLASSQQHDFSQQQQLGSQQQPQPPPSIRSNKPPPKLVLVSAMLTMSAPKKFHFIEHRLLFVGPHRAAHLPTSGNARCRPTPYQSRSCRRMLDYAGPAVAGVRGT
jgi:hypothetical protein